MNMNECCRVFFHKYMEDMRKEYHLGAGVWQRRYCAVCGNRIVVEETPVFLFHCVENIRFKPEGITIYDCDYPSCPGHNKNRPYNCEYHLKRTRIMPCQIQEATKLKERK